jgi:hypothetical protein
VDKRFKGKTLDKRSEIKCKLFKELDKMSINGTVAQKIFRCVQQAMKDNYYRGFVVGVEHGRRIR